MSGTVTSVPEWAVGDPPANRVLRAAEATAVLLELPELERRRADAATGTATPSPVWSAAYRDGYDQGLSAGRTEGLARGAEEAAAEVSRTACHAIEALRSEVTAAIRSQQDGVARLEREAIELALDLAELVVGHHVAASDDPGTEALTRALGAVRASGPFVAHLHPDDLALMGDGIARSNPNVELIEDPGVGRGGCILDAGSCRVDATLGSALERLRQVLNGPASPEVTP
jgi:flagellar assembly protein FliH